MKVLVTGAGGFLGREVVAALAAEGHEVRALVRPSADVARLGWGHKVETVRADLRGGSELAPLLQGVEAVVHLAAQMSGDDFSIFSGTVLGTERLLAAMASSSVRRLILCSSFSVYDWRRIRGRVEDDSKLPTDIWPSGAYAAAKLWQERLARRQAKQQGWELTVLRPGFVWGAGNDEPACIGPRLGRWQLVFGPLRELPLTHVRNCADAFRAVLAKNGAVGGTFNVVDGQRVSAARYARALNQGTGRKRWNVWVPGWTARGFVWFANRCARVVFGRRYRLPSLFTPIRFDLRFKPVRVASTGLRMLIDWLAPHSFEESTRATWSKAAPAIRSAEADPKARRAA